VRRLRPPVRQEGASFVLAPFQQGATEAEPISNPFGGRQRPFTALARSASRLVEDRHAQAHRRTPPRHSSPPAAGISVAARSPQLRSIIRSATGLIGQRHHLVGFHRFRASTRVGSMAASIVWMRCYPGDHFAGRWVVGEQCFGDRPRRPTRRCFRALRTVPPPACGPWMPYFRLAYVARHGRA